MNRTIKFRVLTPLAIALIAAAPVFLWTVATPVALSQSATRYSTGDLVKARNLARQTIEKLNGGLGRYRAENSMHGPAAKSPFVENPDGTLTFKFFGGPPAWTKPTVESEVTVNPANWTVKVNYNGKVR